MKRMPYIRKESFKRPSLPHVTPCDGWRWLIRRTSTHLIFVATIVLGGFGANGDELANPEVVKVAGAQGVGEGVNSGAGVDFLRDVRPIFETHCYECHGPEKQRSGFRLDIREAALKGGDLGRAIVPGEGGESALIAYVSHAVPDMEMPPKGDPLTPQQVSLLRTWVDMGAIWPDGVDAEVLPDLTKHWAFQSVKRPDVPSVELVEWPKNDLDRFILGRLEGEGIAPSPEADRRTLIRRLMYNLHGLPPLPEEVEAFVNDASPDAYEQLVDRLLNSPRYGERWARHWMDVVHYGESHGYDKDKPRPNAWPYRDYVIRSLNSDKPYSRFVEEQIAGDVLYPDEPDGVVALGFIAAGPWDFVGHVELPESKTDGLIARYNDRDDMLMTTMSTFVSLTVHCARCHDHKFDPISQREYYALQAVFAGVDRADRTYDPDPKVHRERRALMQDREDWAGRQGQFEARMKAVNSVEVQALEKEIGVLRDQIKSLEDSGEKSPSNGYHSGIANVRDVEKWVQVDLGASQTMDGIRLVPARPVDFPDTPGFGFPVRFKVEISDTVDFSDAQVVVQHTEKDFSNPGDVPFEISNLDLKARYVRVTATRLWERTADYVFALAELEILQDGKNLALGGGIESLDTIETGLWGRARLVDGYDSRRRRPRGEVEDGASSETRLAKVESLRRSMTEANAKASEIRMAVLSANERQEWRTAGERLREIDEALKRLPDPQHVYAAATKFSRMGNFGPAGGIRPVHLLRRGDVKMPGDVMAPGSLDCLPGLRGDFEMDAEAPEGVRRAALARWLTADSNGLMRRSIVNRVWHYHFGRGIVETPNDFGHMGARPSHPELLDWLAVWFQESGESMKALHRLIVTSATYRQTSGPAQDLAGRVPAEVARWRRADALDGDNRLLWRMNRQRLDGESVRDGLLRVSGRLDTAMGGPSVQQFWFKDDHSPTYDYTRFDAESAEAMRRSVYRFIVRSVPDPFMDTMDCPDPSVLADRRNTTLTALQALALMNNPFVVGQAGHVARHVADVAAIPEGQAEELFLRVLGRRPQGNEREDWAGYIRRHGLNNAARLIVNSNEFNFID